MKSRRGVVDQLVRKLVVRLNLPPGDPLRLDVGFEDGRNAAYDLFSPQEGTI